MDHYYIVIGGLAFHGYGLWAQVGSVLVCRAEDYDLVTLYAGDRIYCSPTHDLNEHGWFLNTSLREIYVDE